MKWNLRSKLGAFVSILLAVSIGFSSFLVLRLYSQDKKTDIQLFQQMTMRQMADELEHLFVLSESVPLDRALSIDSFIFAVEDPCVFGVPLSGGVRKPFQSRMDELKLSPASWVSSFEVQEACNRMTPTDGVMLLSTPIAFSIPYVLTLSQSAGKKRLVMIAMNQFYSKQSGTTFLIDKNSKIVWSADGAKYLNSAFKAVGIQVSQIQSLLQQKDAQGLSVEPIGDEGVISFAKVSGWNLCSLFFKPKLFATLTYALRQSILLILGIFFLGMFIGKFSAHFIVNPLEELRAYSEKLTAGDFLSRIEERGIEEILAVKRAFNTMAAKIKGLLEEVKQKAEVDAELELARQVQEMLIPEERNVTDRVRLFSYMKTATYCGGDWWGFTEISQSNGKPPLTVLMVGDVTGHGFGPALVTAAVRGAISAISDSAKDNPRYANNPKLILEELNRAVYRVARGTLGMSFLAAVHDPDNRNMTILNAGHVLPFLITSPPDGTHQVTAVGNGDGVGFGSSLESLEIGVQTIDWDPKRNRIVLYTDGLIDCSDEVTNRFNRKKLKNSLVKNAFKPSDQLLESLLRDRAAAAGDIVQADDITAIICEVGNA